MSAPEPPAPTDPQVILVVVRTTQAHRQSEALRAAVGLTLRGCRVVTAVNGPVLSPVAKRSVATLRTFGFRVIPFAAEEFERELAAANRVEVWT